MRKFSLLEARKSSCSMMSFFQIIFLSEFILLLVTRPAGGFIKMNCEQ